MENRVKILVMGLENSGKTSIVLHRYKKEKNLLSYLSLKPTRKIDISHVEEEGVDVSIWDYGGQEKYRKSYMKHMDDHVRQADEILFVLDVQDKDKYEKALDYFKHIMDTVKKTGENPKVSLFLHKADPNVEEIAPFITDEFLNDLVGKFLNAVPENIPFETYKTSIYAFFRMKAFHYQD